WEIAQPEGGGQIVARQGGREAWRTEQPYTALLGVVSLPDHAPLVRAAHIGVRAGTPEVRLHDLEATGSMHGSVGLTAVPGISLLGQAISPAGDVALAIRMDNSIKRDVIAAYAAS